MLSLDVTQAALVASTSKTVKWAFHIYDKNGVSMGGVAWATGIVWETGTAWDSSENVTDIIVEDFSGIALARNKAEERLIAPSNVTFSLSNPDNLLLHTDYTGGTVWIELYLSTATTDKQKIAGWKFNIKTCSPGYQKLFFSCEDYLQQYLQGDYPNTRMPAEIFPSNRKYEKTPLCIPVPFGTAYVPLRDVFITNAGYLVLGDPALNYTITKVHSPRSAQGQCEWSSVSFSFTQSTKADASAVNWRVFQAIIADTNSDGTADAAGAWLSPGGPILDPAVQFTRSDTAAITNPADVIEFVLKDMGIPATCIDAASFAAAHAIYDGWALTFNGAFFYKQPRTKVLAQLLSMCHSCLDVGETINLRVLSKTSGKTITAANVIRTTAQSEGSFSYRDITNEDYSDSGYVSYQASGEPQDSFVKVLVPAGAAAAVISNDVLECPFVQNSQDVQRIGILHYQRKLLKEAQVSFTGTSALLALQPDDVITVNAENYGGSYSVLIDSVKINQDCSIQFACSKYSSVFDDWADLAPDVLTIPADTSVNSWQPVIAGPDSGAVGGVLLNALPGRLRIGTGSSYIVLDPASPLRVSLYDNNTEIYRAGNLNGFLGYVANTYGLAIGDANAYLKYDAANGLRIAGAISASTINIGGDDTTSFHVDIDGGIWSGASIANKATAPFRVSSSGALVAASAIITGDYKTALSVGAGHPGVSGIHLSVLSNELYFYGPHSVDADNISLLASIGIGASDSYAGNSLIGKFGHATSIHTAVFGESCQRTAVVGITSGHAAGGVYGANTLADVDTWGVFGSAILGYGVYGSAPAGVAGVYGISTSGCGVQGYSHEAAALKGYSEHSYALYAEVGVADYSAFFSKSIWINDGQIVINEATGSAPIYSFSTTVCPNLNADLWDGYNFSDYLDQSVKQTSKPTFAGLISTGPITLSNYTSFSIKTYAGASKYFAFMGTDDIFHICFDAPHEIYVGAGATDNDPLFIRVGGAMKQVTIDANGFLKGV